MMMRLAAKRPLHPCVCVLSALAVFVIGLMMARGLRLPVLAVALVAIYACFGLIGSTLRCMAMMIPAGFLIALVTLLVRQDLDAAVGMWARIVVSGLAAVPVITMPHINLVRFLTQRRCPRMITLGMLIAVRFLPVLGSEIAHIREAMKTRGVRASLWNVRCFYRALVMPLMLRIINMSDTMALSLETRGFDLENREVSVYRPVRFFARDGVFAACIVILLVGLGVAPF